MSSKIVLDASAVLALLNEEPGHREVEKVLADAVVSSVNVCEVVSVLTNIGVSQVDAECMTSDLLHEIVPFDKEQAFIAASLRKSTKSHGLSLGDRSCLALAKSLRCTVLTADKIWLKLSVPGVKIHLIR